jgi:hypothetical protein
LIDAGLELLTVGGPDTAEAVGLVNEFASAPVAQSLPGRAAGIRGGCAGRRRELRASGVRARDRPQARSQELTAQEAQIATMAAEGRTNQTIAIALLTVSAA